MKIFIFYTVILVFIYLLGFIKKTAETPDWMSREYTTALKGFAILTVVWAHSSAQLGVRGIQFIAGIGVALFLICSGFGLQMSTTKNGFEGYWKKRLLNVAVPFWIVEATGLLITDRFTIRTFALDFFFIKPATSYGWFMQYIAVCYIIFWLVSKLGEKNGYSKEKFLYIAFALWFVIDSLFFCDPEMPFLKARQMFAFPFGVSISLHKDEIKQWISKPALIIGGGYYRPIIYGCNTA